MTAHEGDPVTIEGRPETDWRWYRGHGPDMVEVYRTKGQGRREFKIVAADDVRIQSREEA